MTEQLTPKERQQFESEKYNMMEVMLLDSGRVVVCYPGRDIATVLDSFAPTWEWELWQQLKAWNSRPDNYQPPAQVQLDLDLDDLSLRI